MPDGHAAHVREAIDKIRQGDQKVGFRRLLEDIFIDVETGVARVTGETTSDAMSGIVERFLHEKLDEPDFLNSLYCSERPHALAHRSAINFAISCQRASRDVMDRVVTPPGQDADGDEAGANDLLDWAAASRDDAPNRELDPEQRLADRDTKDFMINWQRALKSLSFDAALLVGVLFIERSPLSEEQVAHLAHTTGRTEQEVLAMLEARAHRQRHKRDEAAGRLVKHQSALLEIQRRKELVLLAMRNLGDDPVGPLEEIDDALRERLNRSFGAPLSGATPGQRRMYISYLHKRMISLARLIQEDQQRLEDPLPAGQEYEDLADILGEISAPCNARERRRVINRVTRRVLRTLATLRQRAAVYGGGADDQ